VNFITDHSCTNIRFCDSSAIFGGELIMKENRKIWHWLILAVLSLIWGLTDNEYLTSSMPGLLIHIFAGVYIINRPGFLVKKIKI
jgi:hypothetical protein